MISLKRKDTIYSCQERLVLSLFNVVDIIVSHVEEDVFFFAAEGFDDELVIMRKEEERTTLACSFTRLKYHFPIGLEAKGAHDIWG